MARYYNTAIGKYVDRETGEVSADQSHDGDYLDANQAKEKSAEKKEKDNDGGKTAADTGAGSGGSGKDDVHYTPPSTTGSGGGYTPIDTSGIDWDKMYLSPSQYKQLEAYGQGYTAAMAAGDTEGMKHYHQLAENLRANAASGIGYSGGSDGSQYLPFPVEEIPDQQKTSDDIWNWSHQKAGLKPTYEPREELAEMNYNSNDYWNQAMHLTGDKPEYTAPELTAEQSMSAQDRWNLMSSMAGDRPEYTAPELTAEQAMNTQERWDYINGLAGPRPKYTEPEPTAEQTMSPEERYNAILGMVGDAPVFESRWDEDKNALARAYLSMNYDNFLNSDQYQAMANRYTTAGQKAMKDVLGQMAARTGGLASSYSGQVAGQAYNDYMSQLSAAAYDMYSGELKSAYDKAMAAYDFDDVDYGRYQDELSQWNKNYGYATDSFDKALEQANYNREWGRRNYESDLSQWNTDRNNAANIFNSVLNQQNYNREWDYGVYRDALSQWNTDRNNASDVISQTLNQQNYNNEWDYTQFLNELAQWNVEHGYATDAINATISQGNLNRNWDRGIYESDLGQWNTDYGYAMDAYNKGVTQANRNEEWNYGVLQQEKADAMDRIQSYLSTGGSYADLPDSLLEASGYSQAELNQLQNYYQSKLAPSGSGGGGFRYLKPDNPTKDPEKPADPAYQNPGKDVMAQLDNAYGSGNWGSAKAFLNYATNVLGISASQVEAWNNRRRVE